MEEDGSDSGVGGMQKKKKTLVIDSSDEESDGSESDGSGEEGSAEEGSEEEEGEDAEEDGESGNESSGSGSGSDSSDSGADVCPICLSRFKGQEVGNPESCDHNFCLDHILEWAKNVTTCPVDRQPFTLVLVRKVPGGKIVRQVPVTGPNQLEEPPEEDPTFCEVGVSQDELLGLLDDPDYDAELPLLRAGPRRQRSQRLVARTRLSERISRLPRRAGTASAGSAVASSSSSAPSRGRGRSASTSTARRSTTTRRKRKTKTKRKTTRAKSSGGKRKTKTRRKKRKGGKKKKTTSRRQRPEPDPYEKTRENLRRLLAIRRMKPGQMAPPVMRAGQVSSAEGAGPSGVPRFGTGLPTLSLQLLHTRGSDVAIERDGRLVARSRPALTAAAGPSGRTAALGHAGGTAGPQSTVSRGGGDGGGRTGGGGAPQSCAPPAADSDPRGAGAYANYLRNNSSGSGSGSPSEGAGPTLGSTNGPSAARRRPPTPPKPTQEEPDLYSDIEPPGAGDHPDSDDADSAATGPSPLPGASATAAAAREKDVEKNLADIFGSPEPSGSKVERDIEAIFGDSPERERRPATLPLLSPPPLPPGSPPDRNKPGTAKAEEAETKAKAEGGNTPAPTESKWKKIPETTVKSSSCRRREVDPIVITDSEGEGDASPLSREPKPEKDDKTAGAAPSTPATPSEVTEVTEVPVSRPAEAAPPVRGPQTPPEDSRGPSPPPAPAPRGPCTPPGPEPSDGSVDQYDPFDPTHSPSASPAGGGRRRRSTEAARAKPAPQEATLTLDGQTTVSLPAVQELLSGLATLAAVVSNVAQPTPAAVPPAAAPSPQPADPSIDMELGSPASPESPRSPDPDDGDDLFEPPRPTAAAGAAPCSPFSPGEGMSRFDDLFGSEPTRNTDKSVPSASITNDGLEVVDDVPNSAVELMVKEKVGRDGLLGVAGVFLRKLNRQERVVEEVKMVLKPYYHQRDITKEQYKHILGKSVNKICHNKSGDINPTKIQSLVGRLRHQVQILQPKAEAMTFGRHSAAPSGE
ncbi:PHD and RING finger domain-containing protein 1 [Amphibalanus amphitrite]|uniref:PHD and RING finger domain-containing protein 1 n=1 Tax=Amphibalanus amphitrite TaxID=1232801 RepID=A0A6A4VX82_AMPAM|nr:PHD and RING finger domain-containing protein 1 [Amphibalanus amphitrite]